MREWACVLLDKVFDFVEFYAREDYKAYRNRRQNERAMAHRHAEREAADIANPPSHLGQAVAQVFGKVTPEHEAYEESRMVHGSGARTAKIGGA